MKKAYYWLWATPLTANPDCCDSKEDVEIVAERYLKAHNKKGHLVKDATEYVEDETHYNYRLIIED